MYENDLYIISKFITNDKTRERDKKTKRNLKAPTFIGTATSYNR